MRKPSFPHKAWIVFGAGLLLVSSALSAAALGVFAPPVSPEALRTLEGHVLSAEENGSSYMSSRSPEDLDSYQRAVREVEADLASVERAAGHRRQARELRQLERLIRGKLNRMEARVRLARRSDA